MFSVIIPLYNKAKYIQKAVDSVLHQTFSDFELIIVNDGSTDKSLEVVQKIGDKRCRIINQSNAGVSIARNTGVKEAIYEYIAFLDADDWWDIHYLEEMLTLINEYQDAGLWAAKYFKVKNRKNNEANIGVENSFTNGYIDYFKVYAKTMWMPISSSSAVIKKEIFKMFNGFKSNIKFGEDFDLWVRIALKYKVAYQNKALVYYNQDVDIENRAVNSEKYYKPENNFIFQLDYLENEENRNPDLKKLLDNLRVYILMKYHISKDYQDETKRLIAKVDFKNQPWFYYFFYKFPILIVKAFYLIRLRGARIKKFFNA